MMIKFLLPPNLGYETLKQGVFMKHAASLENSLTQQGFILNRKVTSKDEFRWFHGNTFTMHYF